MVLRIYCRVAAVVFLLSTAYPMVMKVLEHRLAHDRAYGVLHLASAAIGIYAGWTARSRSLAVLYTATITVAYAGLGIAGWFIAGWFIDGLFLASPWAIPLGAVDHSFHLLLGLAAVAVLVISRRTAGQPGGPGSANVERSPRAATGEAVGSERCAKA